MNATVKTLCDLDRIAIPAEMLRVFVDEWEPDGDLARLGLRYACETEAEIAVAGDTVCCRPDSASYPDGRTILLYTATALPDAEKAAEAAVGKALGESFSAELAGKTVTLTVEKILRRTPAEVNDALVASMGLEGVSTVAEYRAYARDKRMADRKLERSKEITRFLVDKMEQESEFEYDAAEAEKVIAEEMELYAADCADDGEQMQPDEMRAAILSQLKQGWLAKAFCESRAIEIDRASAEEYTDRMLEMTKLMGEQAPPREAILDMALQNEYFRAFYEYIDRLIERKMEE